MSTFNIQNIFAESIVVEAIGTNVPADEQKFVIRSGSTENTSLFLIDMVRA
jgi:hypothetical protein